jgi:hypothetical protein
MTSAQELPENKTLRQPKPFSLKRALLLVSVASLAAVCGAYLISWGGDYRKRQAGLALSREMEAHAIGPDNLPSPKSFYPVKVVPRPPLVKDFQILSVKQAVGKVDDDEIVLAVEINGEARAYPLNMMTGPEREVFNDSLGGRAIAATW